MRFNSERLCWESQLTNPFLHPTLGSNSYTVVQHHWCRWRLMPCTSSVVTDKGKSNTHWLSPQKGNQMVQGLHNATFSLLRCQTYGVSFYTEIQLKGKFERNKAEIWNEKWKMEKSKWNWSNSVLKCKRSNWKWQWEMIKQNEGNKMKRENKENWKA